MTITAKNVTWTASGRLIVDNVSLEVGKGSTVGLVGPNGSGKSSLLRILCGLRRAAAGVVLLGENDIAATPRRHLAQRMAYIEQQVEADGQITVEGVVGLGRTPHRGMLSPWNAEDGLAVEEALAHVGMTDRRTQFWHTLSGGERQRVQIARALAQCPSELLLDEPTNHLDIRHQLETLALVSSLPVTSIVALHDLNLAATFCDDIVVLDKGRVIAAGRPRDVLRPTLIRDVFEVEAVVEPSARSVRIHFLAPAGREMRPEDSRTTRVVP